MEYEIILIEERKKSKLGKELYWLLLDVEMDRGNSEGQYSEVLYTARLSSQGSWAEKTTPS